MSARIGILALFLSTSLSAQFSAPYSNSDGSTLYFVSPLRLKGTGQPLNGKIFAAETGGVSLFRATPRSEPPADPASCSAGGFRDYLGVELAANGVAAFYYNAWPAGMCSYPAYTYSTQLATRAGDVTLSQSVARLSANGRYAAVYTPKTGRLYDGIDVTVLDLQSGSTTPIHVTAPGYPIPALVSLKGGRVIADDGTVVIAFANRGYLATPGVETQPFPVEGATPFYIDAAGSSVLYGNHDLYLYDLKSGTSELLVPFDRYNTALGMSDDAGRLLYLRGNQLRLVDTATLADRALTGEPADISDASISGDGKVVYAATKQGGLLKINADDGSSVTLIGRTPYLAPAFGDFTPGLAPFLNGSALSDTTIQGAPPFNSYLDHVTMWMGERKVPLITLAPDRLRFLIPWDIPPGTARLLAEVEGDRTPFYYPELEVTIPRRGVAAGAIARQDWTQTWSGPVNTGEIIHVYAVGLGPVSPEVPPGFPAPSAEPLARITSTFTCDQADVLFAGLAPATVERVYQIDLRINAPAGYQKFTCRLGGSDPFLFLSLNVQ